MSSNDRLGGIIHTYQKFDPMNFPSPTAPPPDVVSHVFDHMLLYGSTRRLTEEELARAVRLDPSQLRNIGPSLEWLKALLLERKRRILSTYETDHVQKDAHDQFHDQSAQMDRELGSKGVAHELITVKDAGHGLGGVKPAVVADIHDRVLAFLKKYLP